MALTQEGVDRATSRIALLPFFPASDRGARAVLQEELILICESDEHAQWLAIRMGQVFKKGWPGLGELRALYCKRFKPRDGIQSASELFQDGFPSEQELGELNIRGLPTPIPARVFVSKSEESKPITAPESRRLLSGLPGTTEPATGTGHRQP